MPLYSKIRLQELYANIAGMISVGIGEETILHEADYIFKDFTEINTAFIEKLIN